MKTKIKVGRKFFTIQESDLILDNGSCYQILRQNNEGRYFLYNDLSKKLFHELRSLEGVFTSEGLRLHVVVKLFCNTLTYFFAYRVYGS